MTTLTFKIIENPSKEQIDCIGKPLWEYNVSKVGHYQRQSSFTTYAYNENNEFLGGLHGWFQFSWLVIGQLYIDEAQRHAGIGSQLLAASEQFAIEHGILNARLNTGSFQAPDFYKKNGYEIFAQLDVIVPNGSTQIDYFMKKKLLR